MGSKPPAAGLDGEGRHVRCPGVDRPFFLSAVFWGRKKSELSVATSKGGWEKGEWGAVLGQATACRSVREECLLLLIVRDLVLQVHEYAERSGGR